MGGMKTTLDIPDKVFRKAKAAAALRGQSLRDLVTEAIEKHLDQRAPAKSSERDIQKRWQALAKELDAGPGAGSFMDELLQMRKSREPNG